MRGFVQRPTPDYAALHPGYLLMQKGQGTAQYGIKFLLLRMYIFLKRTEALFLTFCVTAFRQRKLKLRYFVKTLRL